MDSSKEETKQLDQTSYENYSASSMNYDSVRKPLGLTEMIQAFKKYGYPHLSSIADIGCGTGNYLIALNEFYDNGVGVDINEGMLKQFNQKIVEKKLTDKLRTVQAPGQQLPLEDNQFQGVIACLTIHHHGSLENKQKFLLEVKRILKPGGVFVINHNTDLHFDSLWYLAENERVKSLMKEKAGSKQQLLDLAHKARLEFKQLIPINDPVVRNPEILLTAEGRSTASVFALFSQQQIESFQKAMKERIEKGRFEKWMNEICQENIKKYGITSHFVFMKTKEE